MKNILIKPLVTEKVTQKVKDRVYGFVVTPHANKAQIKTALEKSYGVTVSAVRIAKRKGKVRRLGRRRIPTAFPDRKVAYVTLRSGEIDLFPKA
ncbi:50S ribosomal protein L23 [Patescibacteria group bacterium]|nr:50S ribosomal protein L23 [Patescibacteria group bacterium]MCL5091671.1 50S ribosomal protein L23 [Patescibacteria group bacterium]